MTSASNFLVNSDYPLDKIVYMDSGSIVVGASSNVNVSIPHNLSFAPLPVFSWSLNSDFSTSRISGIFPYADTTYTEKTFIYTDPTNLNILAINNSTSSKTFYWRAYGFMPSNINVDTPATASLADRFTLNTTYNYSKLYMSGVTAQTTTSITINHGLGYKPRQILLWTEGTGSEMGVLDYNDTDPTATSKVLIDNNDLVYYDSGGTKKLHYRIYLDD